MSTLLAHKPLMILTNYAWRQVPSLAILFGFFIITYFTYFLYSSGFGVYSDDQYFFYLSKSGNYVNATLDAMSDSTVNWGRPFGFLALSIMLYPLLKFGGISTAYLGVCFVLTIEAFLVFNFFRIFLSKEISFIVATIYLLFPADASKFLFVHGFLTHVSSIMFWVGAILYAKGRHIYSAITVALTILVYETHLVQGILIPLVIFTLSNSTGKVRTLKQELRNAAPFFAVFLLASSLLLFWRLEFSPGRLPSELPGGRLATVGRLLLSGWLGIGAVISSLSDRVTWVSKPYSPTIYVAFLITVAMNGLLYRTWIEPVENWSFTKISILWSSMLLICGLLLMYVSYLPFALNLDRWPPIPITSRYSGVHWGSSVGYVLIWISLSLLFAALVPRTIFLRVGGAISLIYAFFIFGFFLVYQERLVQNWNMQTNYWQQIKECIAQANPKLIVLDSDDEEVRMKGSEPIFDWTIAYFPFIVDPTRGHWPLIVTHSSPNLQAEASGDKLRLSSLATWYLFPTEAEIPLSEVMVVKPLGGALVPVSSSFLLGQDPVNVGLTCHVAALGAAP